MKKENKPTYNSKKQRGKIPNTKHAPTRDPQCFTYFHGSPTSSIPRNYNSCTFFDYQFTLHSSRLALNNAEL